MNKIKEILEVAPYTIIAKFDNGVIKQLNVLPLFHNHSKLNWAKDLKMVENFMNVNVGILGEISWSESIKGKDGSLFNYDISPDFFYANAKELISSNS